jgi:hypothetical protein
MQLRHEITGTRYPTSNYSRTGAAIVDDIAKMATCQKGTRDGQGGQDGHRRRALDHLAQTPKAFIFKGLRIKMVKIAKMVTYLSGTAARLKMVNDHLDPGLGLLAASLQGLTPPLPMLKFVSEQLGS